MPNYLFLQSSTIHVTMIVILLIIIVLLIGIIYRSFPQGRMASSSNLRFNEEKEHYKSLIDLFKYSVSLITGLFTVVALIVGFITYENGQDMRDSLDRERQEMKVTIFEMKTELREKETNIQERFDKLISSTEKNISKTESQAIEQIASVKYEATQTARKTAREKIEEVFSENNFDAFATQVIKDHAERQLVPMVNNELERAKNEMISDALANFGSQDPIQQNIGYHFFSSNLDNNKLNEKHLDELTRILETDKTLSSSMKSTIVELLLFQKQCHALDFFFDKILFKRIILSEIHYQKKISDAAIQYIVINETNKSIIQKLERGIGNASDKPWFYTTALNTIILYRRYLVVDLLNITIPNITLSRSFNSIEDRKNFRDNIIYNLKSANFKEEEYINTSFFKFFKP